jgi:hypothetical protein
MACKPLASRVNGCAEWSQGIVPEWQQQRNMNNAIKFIQTWYAAASLMAPGRGKLACLLMKLR